ncbi:MAG: YqgE/AlgH family protein [Paracoccaceae bacterium]
MENDDLDLKGSLLIAMPGMTDVRFAQAVVYLCDYSDKGAMGLIVNKPAADLQFTELLDQLDIEPTAAVDQVPVHFGGPVETGRGFVLHSSDYTSDLRTLDVRNDVALTPTLDVLEDVAAGRGPAQIMMVLGYAGWGPGQLENEIASNGWLTCSAGADFVFDVSPDAKWNRALQLLGIDPALLSADAGTA